MRELTKEILKQAGFRKQIERLEHGFCPTCGQPVSNSDFKDDLSLREYKISGMCQKCQDKVFTGGV